MSLTQDDREWLANLLREQMENVVTLITSAKESLEKEIADLGARMEGLGVRFDNMSARRDRQYSLLQAGTRRVAGLDDWAGKVDQALELKDRQIAELRQRLDRLEQK